MYKNSTTTVDVYYTSDISLLFTRTAENLYKILLTNAVKLNVYFSRD